MIDKKMSGARTQKVAHGAHDRLTRFQAALIARPLRALSVARLAKNFGDGERIRVGSIAGSAFSSPQMSRSDLRRAFEAAESANQAKSRFLATMSHEIRTPMHGILGMTNLLAATDPSSEQDIYIRAINDAARALLSLIDELLDLSKIEAGKLRLAVEPFSLRDCVSRSVALLEPGAKAKGLNVILDIETDVPQIVIGDETRVRQIVLNLVSNAVKFTDFGRVEVRVKCEQSSRKEQSSRDFEISVTDTGIGLSHEVTRKLFVEFEQGQSDATCRPSGTGLGLSISKRLARAMGGDIRAEGHKGSGAIFAARIRLGLSPGMTSNAIANMRHGAGIVNLNGFSDVLSDQMCYKPRVLIAEDNDVNALLTRRVSERAGCRVATTNCGQTAVDAVRQSLAPNGTGFDLILMDISMPDMDGFEATQQIRRLYMEQGILPCDVPGIIAVTANAFPEDRERCLNSGMDGYLAKPFDASQLQAILLEWLPWPVQKRSPAA